VSVAHVWGSLDDEDERAPDEVLCTEATEGAQVVTHADAVVVDWSMTLVCIECGKHFGRDVGQA
jgi:hypothetical protein